MCVWWNYAMYGTEDTHTYIPGIVSKSVFVCKMHENKMHFLETHAPNNTTIFIIRINRFVCFYPVLNLKSARTRIHLYSRLKQSRWLCGQSVRHCICTCEWMNMFTCVCWTRTSILHETFTKALNNFRLNYGKFPSIHLPRHRCYRSTNGPAWLESPFV